eukprot:s2489_g6.t1
MASDPKVDGDELRNFFGSLQISMFTLFAAISGGRRASDADASGVGSFEDVGLQHEFEHGFKVESTRAWFEALGIKAEDAWTIFRSLDRDACLCCVLLGVQCKAADGVYAAVEVSRAALAVDFEFVEGCINIRGPAREVDLMRQSQRTHQQLQAVEGTLLDSLVLLKDIDVATQLIDTSESIRASRSDGLKAPEAQLQQKTADSSHLQGVEEGSSPSAI